MRAIIALILALIITGTSAAADSYAILTRNDDPAQPGDLLVRAWLGADHDLHGWRERPAALHLVLRPNADFLASTSRATAEFASLPLTAHPELSTGMRDPRVRRQRAYVTLVLTIIDGTTLLVDYRNEGTHATTSRRLPLAGVPAVQLVSFPAVRDPVRLVIGTRQPVADEELSYPLAR